VQCAVITRFVFQDSVIDLTGIAEPAGQMQAARVIKAGWHRVHGSPGYQESAAPSSLTSSLASRSRGELNFAGGTWPQRL
jgi:hypothetical protein